MSEWQVFLVIGSLLGFTISIVTPIVKLNGNITRQTVTIERIADELKQQKSDGKQSRERIWNKLDEHSGQLAGHERRVSLLEAKGEKNDNR